MKIDEEQLESHHELYNLLQNDTRRALLEFIYQQPQNYSALIDFSGLKPGSLYHHLKVMKKLVEKRDHGLYGITKLGKQVVEELDLSPEQKPTVTSSDKPITVSQENVGDKPELDFSHDENQSSEGRLVSETEVEETTTIIQSAPSSTELINQIFWLGSINYIIIGLSVIVIVFLALQGVALAGIAIYASPIPLIFDLLAFSLGLFSLYVVEQLVMKTSVYSRLRFALVIRICGMLPAVVVGLSLFLLYLVGIIPSPSVFPYIFAITVALGYLVMVSGLQYLRGMGREKAIQVALIPAGIDLLLGLVVLLVT